MRGGEFRGKLWISPLSKENCLNIFNDNFLNFFYNISEGSELDQPPSKQPKYQCTIRNEKPKESKRHLKELKHDVVTCDQCDYAATKPSHLKQHKEAKHECVRYPCDQKSRLGCILLCFK